MKRHPDWGGTRKGAGRKAGSTVKTVFKIDRAILIRLRTEVPSGEQSDFVTAAIRIGLDAKLISEYQSRAQGQ